MAGLLSPGYVNAAVGCNTHPGVSTLDEQCRSYVTMKNWIASFKWGIFSIEDENLSGRPISVPTSIDIDAVHDRVLSNHRIALKTIRHFFWTCQSYSSRGCGHKKTFCKIHPRMTECWSEVCVVIISDSDPEPNYSCSKTKVKKAMSLEVGT